VLAKIAAMPAPYRAMGERLHALILRSAPALQPTAVVGLQGGGGISGISRPHRWHRDRPSAPAMPEKRNGAVTTPAPIAIGLPISRPSSRSINPVSAIAVPAIAMTMSIDTVLS